MEEEDRGEEEECRVGGVEEAGAEGGGEFLCLDEYLLGYLSGDKYLVMISKDLFLSEILAALHLKALCWGSLHGLLERPGATRKGPIDT